MIRFLLVTPILLLSACSSSDYLRESGSFTDTSATRSNQEAACNTQLRFGDWASFSTAYVYDYKEKTTLLGGGDCYPEVCDEVIKRSGGSGMGFFVVGYDPNASTDYTTSNVCGRWGAEQFNQCGKSLALPYLLQSNVPNGTAGVYLYIEDKPGLTKLSRTMNIRIYLAQAGMRAELTSSLTEYRNSEDLGDGALTYQFDGGEPFLDEFPNLKAGDSWAEILYSNRNWSEEEGKHAEKLLKFLFEQPQPSSLLTVTIRKRDTNETLAVGKVDFRDARSAYQEGFHKYLDALRRGCAK